MDIVNYSYLVLDDNALVSQMVGTALRKIGATQIDFAEDGEVGLRIIAAGNVPDIIITDLNMPNLDGIELINSLAEIHFSGGLLIISGSDDCMLRISAEMAKNRRMNILGTLTKPFIVEQLIETLNRYTPAQTSAA